MSPFCHDTDLDHDGGSGDEVTEDHVGSPERLQLHCQLNKHRRGKVENLNTRTTQRMKCLPNRCDLPTASRRSFADTAS